MPFDYYASLSAKNKRIYLASDRVREILVPDAALANVALELRRLRTALGAASQRASAQSSREIVRRLTEALGVATPETRVHEVRPHGDYGELHGLYTRWEDGRARIEVWMRTAVNERPVAFRTFLRTLAHELVHHLDYVQLTLDDSFHTEGFFARESSLVKQLLATQPQAETRARQREAAPPASESREDKLTRLRERLGAVRKRRPLDERGARARASTASGCDTTTPEPQPTRAAVAPIEASVTVAATLEAPPSTPTPRRPRKGARPSSASADNQLALTFGVPDDTKG
ncbi:MAG: hypothetical protein K1X94_18235 [Sandaracinaceae bacterium]|nr:hypothetical protein [Sandaracinaceae bacterium]